MDADLTLIVVLGLLSLCSYAWGLYLVLENVGKRGGRVASAIGYTCLALSFAGLWLAVAHGR